ncbi:TraR/DksA family transcriptional regulator [Desulfopila inferna]|uniref:TraR/DksA family transcriptional regulator n=1 Tax=Desulfopila inferna TaxID=468528 RepID=UPI0019660469|nr:TraR/DksA C4-type zinc finger protein [Desulfopila inferna]MBM9605575.1 TraR/DksA C4-type zinc finger protein [Desulfopila inferna]
MHGNIDLEYYTKRLIERLAEIMAARQAKKEDTPLELDQTRMGRLSRMDAMQQQAMDKATARLTDLERQRIESALKRIESQKYGYCVVCEEEISEGRLRFDPSVLTCIACALEAEAK